MNSIAITSIPIQPWEQPLDAEKGLRQGTIFPSLYKPFYIVEQMSSPKTMPKDEWENQLCIIQEISFAITDLLLFLDTHPDSQEALNKLNEYRLQRKDLLYQFASNYFPLTQDCEGLWSEGPVPWDNPTKGGL